MVKNIIDTQPAHGIHMIIDSVMTHKHHCI